MANIDMEDVKEFFFKAMLTGWAASAKNFLTFDMPGHKEISFVDGNFRLLDRYCVNKSSAKSAGTTTIWVCDTPVWIMFYGGWYEKGAIKILKDVLRQTYEEHVFVGGRGFSVYSKRPLVYMNDVRQNDFSQFEGKERIAELSDRNNIPLGWHSYQGMSLV